MTSRKKPVMKYRRKTESKTNYKTRLKLLLSRKPRMVVRRSNTKLSAQIVLYKTDGDKIVFTKSTPALKKEFGWAYSFKNIPSAYLLGLLVGKTALENKISDAVLDIGMQRSIKGSRIYAVAKGAIDAGLKISVNKEAFPSEKRILGNHIAEFSKVDSKNFSSQKSQKTNFGEIQKKVEEIKTKILGK